MLAVEESPTADGRIERDVYGRKGHWTYDHLVGHRNPRRIQLEREHDYTSPANWRGWQRVSFSPIAVMTLEYSRT